MSDDELDPPPTDEERASAEALRVELESRRAYAAYAEGDAALLCALRHGVRRGHLDADEHEEILGRALERAARSALPRGRLKARRRVLRGGAFASVALAFAASVLLYVRSSPPLPPRDVHAVRVRSSEPLFDAPFGPEGRAAVARIDRIASARSSDFRENRFASWGVR